MVGMLFSIPVANMKLAMSQSPSSSSARKGDLLDPPHPRLDHKQPPGMWLHFKCRVIEVDARRTDIEQIEIPSSKSAAGWSRDGHSEGLKPLALGRIAAQAPAVPKGYPQAALRIHGHAVRQTFALLAFEQDAAIERLSFLIKVEPIGGLPAGIIVIHDLAVRAECRAVGHPIPTVAGRDLKIGIDSVERAAVGLLKIVHCSCPEAPLAVELAVVETILGKVRFRFSNDCIAAGGRIHFGNAILGSGDKSALSSRSERTNPPRSWPFGPDGPS